MRERSYHSHQIMKIFIKDVFEIGLSDEWEFQIESQGRVVADITAGRNG